MGPEINKVILCRHWVHSHEEDTDAEMVFRPATFPFPRSRGRRAFELMPDGRLVHTGIGPADAPESVQGTWELEGDTLTLHPSSAPQQVMKIAAADENRLVIRRR